MPFVVGSDVAVVRLRRHGRVLEVFPGNRYRVAMGGLTMVCQEGQLEPVSHSKKKQRRERDASADDADTATPASSAPAADSGRFQSIDLHGTTVPEALAALSVFLDHAIRADLPRVEIIHGISGGRLRAAVRRYLADTPAVTSAVPDVRNPGVTIAYFSGRQNGSPKLCSRRPKFERFAAGHDCDVVPSEVLGVLHVRDHGATADRTPHP